MTGIGQYHFTIGDDGSVASPDRNRAERLTLHASRGPYIVLRKRGGYGYQGSYDPAGFEVYRVLEGESPGELLVEQAVSFPVKA